MPRLRAYWLGYALSLISIEGLAPPLAQCGTLPHLSKILKDATNCPHLLPFAFTWSPPLSNPRPFGARAFCPGCLYCPSCPLCPAENSPSNYDRQLYLFCYPLPIGKVSQKEGNKWNVNNAVMITIFWSPSLSFKFVANAQNKTTKRRWNNAIQDWNHFHH